MRSAERPDEGRTTPFDSAAPGLERVFVAALLAIRAVHVLQGLACVLTARSAYRRPRVAAATALGFLAELVWLSRRDLSEGAHSAPSARADNLAGAVGLLALASATDSADRTSSLNWMMPLTVGGCLGSAASLSRQEGAAVSAGMGATYAVTTRGSIVAGAGKAATVLANTLSYPGFYMVADFTVRTARRLGTDLDEARRAAIVQGSRAAAEEARNREHRMLHDSALQTLEAVADGFELDPDEVRRQARSEAAALRLAISGQPAGGEGVAGGLSALASDFSARGLHVELLITELAEEPSSGSARVLCDASREALTNVLKHAGVSRVIVRAASAGDGVLVVVRDRGSGFDPADREPGFGIPNSILKRLEEGGGKASVESSPGRGTRVELWIPQ